MIVDNIPVSVLLVDDNPSKLLALAAPLEGMGVEIVTADSGMEALRKLLAQEFAVVLLDVNMPIMDGFETATMIRARPRSEHLPIIFVTSEALSDASRLKGYGLGAVDYILSPVLPQILRSKVATFADLYRLREQSRLDTETLRKQNEEIAHQSTLLEEARRKESEHLATLNRMLEEQVETRTHELRAANELLRVAAITFETREAIIVTDANANIIRVNQAFQDMTGYSEEEVMGKNPRILSAGHHSREFYKEMWRQLIHDGTWCGELWDRRKNGQTYPKWQTITAVKDDTGKVTEYVAISSDITQRKQTEEEITKLAFYDPLTELPNRRLLLERLQTALAKSARNGLYGALLFLDMDRFKVLNDTLGHSFGDLMLIEAGRRIQACLREVDTTARLGGDEFVVLIEEIHQSQEETSLKVALIAEKIRTALSVVYQLKDNEHHSTPSIGVCLYRGHEETSETLLKRADMAMYQAKDSGRNAVRFFDPAMQLASDIRFAMETDLRRALPEGELQLYYQIQIDNDHRPIGAEALIRWTHPTRGLIFPTQFIPIAEESSLILDIWHWVLETACRQLGAWEKTKQTRDLTLAVNVSAKQFKQHDFVETIAQLLSTYKIRESRLKLKLTESIVLSDVDEAITKMHALRALAVRLSLDDFGTGYSSLPYLKRLPLHQIKIDQSFVCHIAADRNDAVMVKSIIDMAQNFGLHVIAEGVETQEQWEFLKQNGCMAYQGYLFSKSVPIEAFKALLKQGISHD